MLADGGVISMQLGKAPNPRHPSEFADKILGWLEDDGMESFHQYENVSIALCV